MHDHTAQGNDFFKCDFCRRAWADSLPMVEGHQGSLICAECLTAAFTRVVVENAGEPLAPPAVCALCLEQRADPHWRGPLADAFACKRCIKQSAAILERDPDVAWKRPATPKPA
jgi:hypothetical protein